MTQANAEHGFAFIAFDCPVYTLAVFVTHFGADVRCVESWLVAGCKPMPYPSVVTIHVFRMPSDSQE
jgi:hypothetical protein